MQGIQGQPGDDTRQDGEMRMLVDIVKHAYATGQCSHEEAVRALFDADVPASVAGRVLR